MQVECTDSNHCTGTTPGIVSGKPGLKISPTVLDMLKGGPKVQSGNSMRPLTTAPQR